MVGPRFWKILCATALGAVLGIGFRLLIAGLDFSVEGLGETAAFALPGVTLAALAMHS